VPAAVVKRLFKPSRSFLGKVIANHEDCVKHPWYPEERRQGEVQQELKWLAAQ